MMKEEIPVPLQKLEQDQTLGGSRPGGVTQGGGISARLAFTVFLKRLNLKQKGEHFG